MKDKIFETLEIWLINKDETELWEKYLDQYHYLGYKNIIGKSLRYVATIENEWVALIGWGSPALICNVRDKYIGWDQEKKYKRLDYVLNNIRYLILPWVQIKNLASKILSINLKRLSSDFQEVYGHPIYLAETFVDISKYKGTCYQAGNWKYLGNTSGFSKNGKHYYKNNQPKAIFIYSLNTMAKEILNSDLPLNNIEIKRRMKFMEKDIELPVTNLIELIKKVVDPRKARGIRHPFQSVLGIAVCAVLFGARSFEAIADWANGLPKKYLVRFGTHRAKPPSEPTFRRVIQSINTEEFDKIISQFILENEFFKGLQGVGIAIDGKTLRGSGDGEQRAIHLLSAVTHKEAYVIAQQKVDSKTNEIKAVEPIFKDMNIEGAIITSDALLTQRDIANYLVDEKKADYVFTVKENQKTLLDDIVSFDLKKTSNQKQKHLIVNTEELRTEESMSAVN